MDGFKFSDDGQTVKVDTLGIDASFSVAQVERLLTIFGAIRAQMEPAVPLDAPDPKLRTYRPLQSLFALQAPRGGESSPLQVGALLVGRSAQFGWFDFEMDPEFCKGLVAWLTAQPELINPPAGTTLN